MDGDVLNTDARGESPRAGGETALETIQPILQVKNLTHTYGIGTLEGEFLGIIGHTGSGKSTLIQHLNGLLRPTSGQVLLSGKDIWAEPRKIRNVRFRVGLVFQYPEYQLFEETV